MGGRRRIVVDQCRTILLVRCAVTAATRELGGKQLAADGADDGRHEHDPRKVDLEEKDADEGQRSDAKQHFVFDRLRPDAPGCEQYDGDHGRPYPVKDALDQGEIAIGQIDCRQRREQHEGREKKQDAGHHSASDAVHQPGDVDGELGRFRTRQQHAIVECMEEALLGNPAPFFDQFLMHHGDLAGWAAEADEAEFQPVGKRLGQSRMFGALQVAHEYPFSAERR